MDEDQLNSAFLDDTTKSESNKEAFQEDMVNAMQVIKKSQNATSGGPLSSIVILSITNN
jgi:hypothetical protein